MSAGPAWMVFRQFLSFGIVGLTGVVVGLGTLNICMLIWHNFPLANVAAFLVAVTWNFFLNRRFTFTPTDKVVFRQWLEFITACLGGTLLNWIVSLTLYYSLVFFHYHYNFAAIIGIAVAALSNFTCSRLYVFKNKREKTFSDDEQLETNFITKQNVLSLEN